MAKMILRTTSSVYCVIILVLLCISCDNDKSSQSSDQKQQPDALTEDIRLLFSGYKQKALKAKEDGQLDSCIYWYTSVGDLYAQTQEWDSLYEISRRIFHVANDQNDFEEVNTYLVKYSETVAAENDTTWAKFEELLGFIQMREGDYEKALQHYKGCASVLEKYPVSGVLLNAYNWQGIFYTILGDYPLAETMYNTLLRLSIEKKDTFLLKKCHTNLGKAQLSQGNWELAIENFERAQALIPYEDGFYEHNLAKGLIMAGQAQSALPLAMKALEKRSDYQEQSYLTLADVYNSLGEVYFAIKKYDEAEKYFKKSLDEAISNYPIGHRAIGKAHIFVGNSYQEQGLNNLALSEYQQAIQIFLPAFNPDNITSCPSSKNLLSKEVWLMEALRSKGKVFQQKFEEDNDIDHLVDAATHYQTAVDFINQIKLYYTEQGSKAFIGDYAIPFTEDAIQTKLLLYEKTKDPVYQQEAFELAQQATAFLLRETVNEQRAMEIANVPFDTIAQLKNLNANISELQTAKTEATDTLTQDSIGRVLFKSKRERLSLLEMIEQNYPEYYQLKHALAPISLESVQAALDDSTLVVKYFLGEENLYTFAFSNQRIQSFSAPIDTSFFEHVQTYRKTLGDLDYIRAQPSLAEEQFIESSTHLYQDLLQPVLDTFEQDQLTKLALIPDGILNYLSFECMPTRSIENWLETDAFLISRYAVRYAYYTGLLLSEEQQENKKSRFVGFGTEYDDKTLNALDLIEQDSVINPELKDAFRGKSLSKLLYADDEVDEVADLVSGKAFLNSAATKANFLQHTPNYDAIHVATHSFIDSDNDSTAYIVFNQDDSDDYLLSLPEIYGLDLNADLIALSSCQSSLGALERSEGVMSLARAFKFAGSKSLVASQWSISDRSSFFIMKQFYKNLQKGLAKDEALQKAKLAYLSDDQLSSPAYRIPAYWGALVMIGDAQAMSFENTATSWYYWVAGIVLVLLIGIVAVKRNSF